MAHPAGTSKTALTCPSNNPKIAEIKQRAARTDKHKAHTILSDIVYLPSNPRQD